MTVEELKEELKKKWPNHLVIEFIDYETYDDYGKELKILDFKREYGKLIIEMEEE